jgi:formate hydrogenlyase subunit 3/multisubunit Na+/H+ antiporter MnhD subunit
MGTLILMCYLTIQGIFEDDLEKYLIISNFIQTLFVFLDLTVASVTGSIASLGTIQIFNYTFAGSLLFITLGILSKDNRRVRITQLRGSNYRNTLITTCASIAALSLAGVPGLNMFVSEWLLFQKAFLISPVITIFGIFLALLLFVMYFKIVYVLSVGDSKIKEKSPTLLNILSVGLAIICIIFGLIPNLQYLILSLVG